ncbi:MAG: PPOX class F420-dependent oxidoreductase [Anaerolineae bacterium]
MSATATQTARPFTALDGHKYMNLTTFRKSGAGVVTPVWFAESGGRLYVMTQMSTGKTKRIRNNGRVEVAPSDRAGKPLGPSAPGQARLLSGAEADAANDLLSKKYGLMKRMFELMGVARKNARVFIEITPAL